MKKILSFLAIAIVLMALVVCFLLPAKAATEGKYTYTVSDGKATITNVSTSISGSITIPSTLGGYPVTDIYSSAFEYCNYITSITIPNSVKTIGFAAFRKCTNLTSIIIPDSVTIIGINAFYGCNKLTNVTIGNGVKTIGAGAFEGCTSLTSITIPDGVTSIEREAFYNCTSLKDITVPDSITFLGVSAFIGTKWFNDHPDGIVYAGKFVFIYKGTCPADVIIKEGTLGIASSAFSTSSTFNLTSITIPNSVTHINDRAFPNSLETIYYNGTEEEWNKITIGSYNDSLLNAELITQSDPIEEAVAGTTLTMSVVDGETVIIVPTSQKNVAMTESELAAILNDASITITSNNGIIGTGCKVTIGEYEVDLVVKGDIDGDGVATVFDALMVKKALANNGFENEALREFAAAVDGATGTTEADVDAILSYIVGKGFINNSESIELASCYSGNSISDTSLSVITLTYLNENKYDVAIRSYTSQFTEDAREPIVVNGITYSYLGGGGTPDAEYTINNDNTITFTISGFSTATYEHHQNNLHRISYDGNDFFPEVFEVA